VTALAERYRDRLPLAAGTPLVTLGEGSTPLLPAPRLSERLGLELWLKWEGSNPTGSFKDRGMTVAVAKALEDGVAAVVCASTGNTAASAAAYAARAGIAAVILQPAGAVARGKIVQAQAAGARLLEVQGPFEAALDDALALPYGGGGNTRAYALGFDELGSGLPRLLAGESSARPFTLATAIRISEPAHRAEAEAALARSGGAAVPLEDEEILAAWRDLARLEGIFCEPASAAGLAAVVRERPDAGARVVCVVTGHGLKDPDAAARLASPPLQVPPDPDAIAEAAAP
jgi:threonine synthase